jgi:hypothetical protein
LWIVLTFLFTTVVGQNKIKESSIKKKHRFKTTIILINEQTQRGQIVGVSDSTLTIAYKVTYVKGLAVYNFREFNYAEINEIKIRHSIPGKTVLSTIIGMSAGFVSGYSLASSASNEAAIPLFITSLTIGTFAGAGIPFLARKKYKFPINGNLDSFKQNVPNIKLLLINNSSLN